MIKTYTYKLGDRYRKIAISTSELNSFKHYWPAYIGFISGLVFLIGIWYYLNFKEKKQLEINELINIDYLTKAFNRVHFDEQIESSLNNYHQYNKIFSIILLAEHKKEEKLHGAKQYLKKSIKLTK